jgi:hypothetical protein
MAAKEPDNPPRAQPERDPWFNPHLGPRGIPAHKLLIDVLPAVEKHKRRRAMRAVDQQTLYRVVIPLVLNLVQHNLNGSPGRGIPVPRSNKELGKKGDRYQPFLFPRTFPKMLDALSDLGFAKVTLGKYSGFPGQSKRTTVRAGPKLIELIEKHKVTLEDLSGRYDEEVIILSRPRRDYWDEGERIDYKDTATTEWPAPGLVDTRLS